MDELHDCSWRPPRGVHSLTVLRATLVATIVLVVSACTDAGPDDALGTAGSSSGDRARAAASRAPGPTAGAPAAPVPSRVEFLCGAIEHDVDLPDSYAVIADVVALPTADSADMALQTSHRENKPAPNYFAKTGLLAQAGAAFTIEVNERPETAQIHWGSPDEFGSTITTDGCPGNGWLAFAGGFLVDEPRCVELTVRTASAEETVQVGVGAPCGGQQPPPEPTDP